jgi:hypothetical protein
MRRKIMRAWKGSAITYTRECGMNVEGWTQAQKRTWALSFVQKGGEG